MRIILRQVNVQVPGTTDYDLGSFRDFYLDLESGINQQPWKLIMTGCLERSIKQFQNAPLQFIAYTPNGRGFKGSARFREYQDMTATFDGIGALSAIS